VADGGYDVPAAALIILGVILRIIGFVAKVAILWTVGGRRHSF
jgi:hypothetical protein